MHKLFAATAGLTTALGLAALLPAGAGQTQQPPIPNREPFTVPIVQQAPVSSAPGYLPTMPGYSNLPKAPQQGTDFNGGIQVAPQRPDPNRSSPVVEFLNQNFDEPDINADIAVREDSGKFMVCLISYTGNDAPRFARDMVREIRGNPRYNKLPAYVFTSGAEERKAELKRIADYVREQRQMLKDNHKPADTPVRVPLCRYELQCVVLVGSYKDYETAHRALDQMKKWEPPDSSKVKLHSAFAFELDDKSQAKAGKDMLINPFAQGMMVVQNPSIRVARESSWSAEDLISMKRLNADEPYSLLKSPKKYTLVIKQYSLDMEIVTSSGGGTVNNTGGFFGNFGAAKPANKQDTAAIRARFLAEVLRQGPKVDAYVLHTKYRSYVSVGSYDSPDDPRLIHDRDIYLPQITQKLDARFKVLAQPLVMQKPG